MALGANARLPMRGPIEKDKVILLLQVLAMFMMQLSV